MPAREGDTNVRSPLAELRLKRKMTQQEMADATGISLTQYRSLERGAYKNARASYLMNCAIVLGCRLDDLVPRQWEVISWKAAEKPDPQMLWNHGAKAKELADQQRWASDPDWVALMGPDA